jgi:histidinol phosphatase-like enzyme (inositol monophosphatase family)
VVTVPDEALQTLLDFATDAAWQAGKITLSYFGTGIVPEFKSDQTPVTVADRQAENLLRTLIEARFPDHAVLGEEYGESNAGARYRWILDPIDGTKSFVQGVPLYGVLIGLEQDGVPMLGVCYLPALDEMIAAGRGLGCTLNGRRVGVSAVKEMADAVFLTTDVAAFSKRGRHDVYHRLEQATRFSRTWGDCYGHILVATGRAEMMLDSAMNVWDCAALLPILQEAGGTFTDWQGNATIHGPDAFSTNGHLFERVLDVTRGA